MKYLNKYEEFETGINFQPVLSNEDDFLNEGDLVVLIKESADTRKFGFIIGNIYHITMVDDEEDYPKYPYEISELSEDYGIWVKENQIRKATKLEEDSVKYNL